MCNIPKGWDQSFQWGTEYFMGFTEIFGLGGPNILNIWSGGTKSGGDKMFRDKPIEVIICLGGSYLELSYRFTIPAKCKLI